MIFDGFTLLKFLLLCLQFIDTGVVYGNELDIGKALTEELKSGNVKREDLYICSKLNSDQHSESGAYEAVKDSLKALNLDYIDLYLIHWPLTDKPGPTLNPPAEVRHHVYQHVLNIQTEESKYVNSHMRVRGIHSNETFLASPPMKQHMSSTAILGMTVPAIVGMGSKLGGAFSCGRLAGTCKSCQDPILNVLAILSKPNQPQACSPRTAITSSSACQCRQSDFFCVHMMVYQVLIVLSPCVNVSLAGDSSTRDGVPALAAAC